MISIIDKQYANDLAAGNIDMKNGNKQNSFPCLQMVSCTYKCESWEKGVQATISWILSTIPVKFLFVFR